MANISDTHILQVARAAIMLDGVIWTVPPPGRHGDVISRIVATDKAVKFPVGVPSDQGFLTNDNRFVTRWQAYRIAYRAGQHKDGEPELEAPHIASELYSESLW